MGFFSRLTRSITGGWAEVSLVMAPAQRGRSAAITVTVAVRDEPISIGRVYARMRCVENIDIPHYPVGTGPDRQQHERRGCHRDDLRPAQAEAGDDTDDRDDGVDRDPGGDPARHEPTGRRLGALGTGTSSRHSSTTDAGRRS